VAPIVCPACGEGIAPADVNVAEGVALCRRCRELTRLSEIAAEAPGVSAERALTDPPPSGCRVVDDGVTMRVEASARSLGGAVVSLFFALFWNSIVGVFVAIVAASYWVRLVGPLPAWAPSQGPGGPGGPKLPLGVAIFMTLFLVPFVAVGVFMLGVALVSMMGRVAVTVRGGEGLVFTGVGAIGRRQRFDALAVKAVQIGETRHEESKSHHIVIEGERPLKFGSVLKDERRAWMAAVLRGVLVPGTGRG
jgi:hypothetical protein